MQEKPSENEALKDKLLDIEAHIIKIETINNILETYTAENSPECSIISRLFSKELYKITKILNC